MPIRPDHSNEVETLSTITRYLMLKVGEGNAPYPSKGFHSQEARNIGSETVAQRTKA